MQDRFANEVLHQGREAELLGIMKYFANILVVYHKSFADNGWNINPFRQKPPHVVSKITEI